MIHSFSATGDTRLEALHALLSEAERLDLDISQGIVRITWNWKNMAMTKVDYRAYWTDR